MIDCNKKECYSIAEASMPLVMLTEFPAKERYYCIIHWGELMELIINWEIKK